MQVTNSFRLILAILWRTSLFLLVAGNLWFPIAIHFAWNFLLGPVLGLTVSGSGHLGLGWKMVVVDGPALFTGGAFGLEGGLVVTMTTAACIVAMIFYRRYQMRNARVFASVA